MRLIDADALLYRLKQPTVEDINEVLRVEYDNAPNDVLAAEAVYNMYETVREAIKDAPTIESPRPDWTPCAEGMPTDSKPVHITVLWDGIGAYALSRCFHYTSGKWYSDEGEECDDKEIIAWMPKIAPYRADQKEDAE